METSRYCRVKHGGAVSTGKRQALSVISVPLLPKPQHQWLLAFFQNGGSSIVQW
jgi:hypothetical protein